MDLSIKVLFGNEGRVSPDKNLRPGHNALLLRLITGDL